MKEPVICAPSTRVCTWHVEPSMKGDISDLSYCDGLTGSRIYALSIATKIDDLGWPWTAETRFMEPTKKFNEGRPVLSAAKGRWLSFLEIWDIQGGSKKVSCYTLVDNFGKFEPISIIILPLNSQISCGIGKIKSSTAPEFCCHTTLWKLNVQLYNVSFIHVCCIVY